MTESSAMSAPKMPKEKVKVYPEKNAVSIRGSTWTLWIRRVKTNDGRVMFLFKPLELHYNQETKQFHYEDLKTPIWLEKRDVDKVIGTLIELTEEEANQHQS